MPHGDVLIFAAAGMDFRCSIILNLSKLFYDWLKYFLLVGTLFHFMVNDPAVVPGSYMRFANDITAGSTTPHVNLAFDTNDIQLQVCRTRWRSAGFILCSRFKVRSVLLMMYSDVD